MPTKDTPYAFFVSYRHTGNCEADKFICAFVRHLKAQVALYLPSIPVFFDVERMGAGDDLSKLARSLCRSAAMVLIYDPLYFDVNHPYCAREFQAMLTLEHGRSDRVGGQDGAIIPVIFREGNCLPEEIKNCGIHTNFDHIVAVNQFNNSQCQERIKKIAKKIYQRYEVLHNAGIFSSDNCACGQFEFLPEYDADFSQWLQRVATLKNPPLMPGH